MKKNRVTLLILVLIILLVRFLTGIEISGHKSIWFADIKNLSGFKQGELKKLAGYTFNKVNNHAAKVTLSKDILNDKEARIVFLSVSDGQNKARVFTGIGIGLLQAANIAIDEYFKSNKQRWWPRWTRLDIVDEVIKEKSNNFSKDSSLYGFATDRITYQAFLSAEVIANKLITLENKPDKVNIINYALYKYKDLPSKEAKKRIKKLNNFFNKEGQDFYAFSTKSYLNDNKKIIVLYRNHKVFNSLNNDDLLLASIEAGEYFKRTVDKNGRFVYLYSPITGKAGSSYNILRHAGSVYSMLELYEVTKDKELLATAKRGIEYLKRQARYCKNSSNKSLCIIEKDLFKLGSNGLAAVAIAKYQKITEDNTYNNLLLALGAGMLERLEQNGNFRVHKEVYSTGQVLGFRSSFYPGEAILGLLRIYELNKDKKWLEAVIRAANYRINSDPDYAIEKRDHWFLYCLNDLYRYRKDDIYLTHGFKIADYISRNQLSKQEYQDQNGAYFRSDSVTFNATKSEAVCTAYKLAKDFGYTDNQHRYKNALIKSIMFQLQFQLGPELSMYFDKPGFALGGFYKGIGKYNVRNDYVQHNLSSIVCLGQMDFD